LRNIGCESRASDPNRTGVFRPRLRRITSLDWIVTDPLDGLDAAEHRWHQIADRQVFDFAFAFGGENPGAPKKAVMNGNR